MLSSRIGTTPCVGIALVSLIVAVLVMTPCATASGSWVGRDIADLVQKLGPLSRTDSLPKGRIVYTWVDRRGQAAGALVGALLSDADAGHFAHEVATQVGTREIFAIVDESGIIRSGGCKGNCQ